ncbi:sugar transferase [Sporosarcina sp. ITBMC105]
MYKLIIKRIIDIVFSILLMPFVIFVIIICAILIKFEDKGPVFYLAKRLGKNKKEFKMYKIRTMKVNSPDLRNEDGSTYNSKNDSRVTKIGEFLRRTSIDEVPQIINVLKGDMSFIGPRPDLPEHVYYYKNKDFKKLEVLPGISGYNQAYFRNSTEWKNRLKNDVYYVENISFILDFKIIIKTIYTIFFSKGVYIDSQNQ